MPARLMRPAPPPSHSSPGGIIIVVVGGYRIYKGASRSLLDDPRCPLLRPGATSGHGGLRNGKSGDSAPRAGTPEASQGMQRAVDFPTSEPRSIPRQCVPSERPRRAGWVRTCAGVRLQLAQRARTGTRIDPFRSCGCRLNRPSRPPSTTRNHRKD